MTLVAPTPMAPTPVPPGSPDRATATLTDDDLLSISLERTPSDGEFREGGAGEAGQASFTLRTRGGTPTAPVTVPYTVTGGVSAVDLSPPSLSGSATLPAGATSATFSVTAADDGLTEGDETLIVTLGTPTATQGEVALGDPARAEATLVDDEGPVVIRIGNAPAVEEGEPVALVIATSRPLASAITGLTYSTVDGSAEGGPAGGLHPSARGRVLDPGGRHPGGDLDPDPRRRSGPERDAEDLLRVPGRHPAGRSRPGGGLRAPECQPPPRRSRPRFGTTTSSSRWCGPRPGAW